MHGNEMNDAEFVSFKFANWNSEWGGDQISHYAELVFSKKLGPPSLISVNFRKLAKVLLNHVKYIEI